MSKLSVSEAQAIVLRHADRRHIETVPLESALGRVLADDILANRDLPPYDVSAMDGYALRSADLTSGTTELAVVEEIGAGDRPHCTIAAGQCARIMTGAPVPPGADAVIRVEETQMLADGRVAVTPGKPGQPIRAGNDIRPRGENLRRGQVAAPAGSEVTPALLGVLATVKAAQLAVFAQPRVAILATGDELEALGDPFDPQRIPDANSYALLGQCQALGIAPTLLGIARDEPQQLTRALAHGIDAEYFDVLLVSGGTSLGVHDQVRPTLAALGVNEHFWRVEMRPGHPVAFATTAAGGLVFCLPGNPVSSMVCFEQFVVPALRCLMGNRRCQRRTINARLAHAVKTRPGRTEFIRVVLSRDAAGDYLAQSTGNQSSGVLLSLAVADGLLVVPADSSGFAAGETATVQLLDATAYQDGAGF